MLENEATTKLLDEIRDSTNVYEYITKYDTDFPALSYQNYIELVLEKKEIKKSLMVKRSGMQRNYAYQLLSGKRNPSRDKIIRFCYGLELDLAEAQKLLNLASFNPLYPKSKRDSIIIFSLCNHYTLDETMDLLSAHGEEFLD